MLRQASSLLNLRSILECLKAKSQHPQAFENPLAKLGRQQLLLDLCSNSPKLHYNNNVTIPANGFCAITFHDLLVGTSWLTPSALEYYC